MKKWDYTATTSNIYRLPHHLGLSLVPETAYSHYGRIRNAIDLVLTQGTPVFSALDGIVEKVMDRFEDNGKPERRFLPKANMVIIGHKNNEHSAYVHLRQNSITVAVGQVVRQNQLIGHAGLSGYTSFSHLHFEVYLYDDEFDNPTLLVQFRHSGKIFSMRSPNK